MYGHRGWNIMPEICSPLTFGQELFRSPYSYQPEEAEPLLHLKASLKTQLGSPKRQKPFAFKPMHLMWNLSPRRTLSLIIPEKMASSKLDPMGPLKLQTDP